MPKLMFEKHITHSYILCMPTLARILFPRRSKHFIFQNAKLNAPCLFSMFLCDTQVSQENKSFFAIISKYHMEKKPFGIYGPRSPTILKQMPLKGKWKGTYFENYLM
jgi:hypothetical protein